MTCAAIQAATGVTIKELQSFNSELDCSKLVPPNTFLCVVTPASAISNIQCLLSYTAMAQDSCSAIESAFDLDDTTFGLLNPSVQCTTLASGDNVCLEAAVNGNSQTTLGGPLDSSTPVAVSHAANCNSFQTVTSPTACLDIATAASISITSLVDWNGGLNCWGLKQNDTLCVGVGSVASTTLGTTLLSSTTTGASLVPSPIAPSPSPIAAFPPPALPAPIATTSAASVIQFIQQAPTSSAAPPPPPAPPAAPATTAPAAPIVQVQQAPATTAAPPLPPATTAAPPPPPPATSAAPPPPPPAPAAPSPPPVVVAAPVATVAAGAGGHPEIPFNSGGSPGSGASYVVSWNWFVGPTTDCDASITAEEFNTGFYAGAQEIPAYCGQTATFSYNGNSVTVKYAWMTTGGTLYHELSPAAFAQLIGSGAKVQPGMTPQQYQVAINDPGRVTATCSGSHC
ncbi:hypothetical protein HDU98_010007 [Podochytrium sp. JEL0797]|nr:hypothetical protein HDU98_010007 [Podochytrium sp. JEL0797]